MARTSRAVILAPRGCSGAGWGFGFETGIRMRGRVRASGQPRPGRDTHLACIRRRVVIAGLTIATKPPFAVVCTRSADQRFRMGRPEGKSKASLVSTFRLDLITTALAVSISRFGLGTTGLPVLDRKSV